MRLRFDPLTPAHLPLLTRWLQAPHVRAFWDDGERDEGAVAAHYFRPGRDVPGFVVTAEGRPVGFLQRERVMAEHAFAPWAAPRGETWGIDLLIGEPDVIGHGLGPRVIRAFVSHLRAERPAVRRLIIDPEARNTRAVRAYAKAGFVPAAELVLNGTPYHLMTLDLPEEG